MTPIHLRNIPPPMETFNHIEFLVLMAKWLKPEVYVELGVRHGDSFWPIAQHCKMAYGVDIDLSNCSHRQPLPNMVLTKRTTDDFFASLTMTQFKCDMVFIDADHSFKSAKKDFDNAAKYIVDDGFIFLHDTYPFCEEMTQPCYCNDCWQTPLYIKKEYGDTFEVVTLPFNPGLTICKKLTKKLSWLQTI